MIWFSATVLLLAAVPAGLYLVNRFLFRPAAAQGPIPPRLISVLIPARDEEANIQEALRSVQGNRDVAIEVLVLDDDSLDRTPEIVSSMADEDPRIRLIRGTSLPSGWSGKQHACWRLAHEARGEVLVFMDADVRLSPDALVRMSGFLERSGADLVSGFPRQLTGSWLEHLVIPLMHFILLGFLPLARMRSSRGPAYGAGNGQLFMARREAYEASGGHRAVRSSMHDGLKLPRAFRRAGFATDIFDATDIASVRMYRGSEQVWQGLAKNATEGLAGPRTIVPASLLLIGGQVIPPFLFPVLLLAGAGPLALVLAGTFALLSGAPRIDAALRFRQSLGGALLHPLGIMVFLVIQWYALAREQAGRPVGWKGRRYGTDAAGGSGGV